MEDAQSVTDIALDAGYEAPDAFARAFRQRFGQSPSSFRKSPDWATWLAAFGPLDNARSKLMQIDLQHADDVTIRDVPPTPVAIMEHRGDPETFDVTIRAVHRLAQGGRPFAGHQPDLQHLRAPSGVRPIRPTTAWISASGRDIADRRPTTGDEGRRHSRRTLRGAARCRQHAQSRAGCAVSLPGLVAGKRRGGAENSRCFAGAHFSAFPGVEMRDVVVELFLPLK